MIGKDRAKRTLDLMKPDTGADLGCRIEHRDHLRATIELYGADRDGKHIGEGGLERMVADGPGEESAVAIDRLGHQLIRKAKPAYVAPGILIGAAGGAALQRDRHSAAPRMTAPQQMARS